MKALFIKDWKLLKNQGKMFGAVLVFYGLLAVMDNSMGQSILGSFLFLFAISGTALPGSDLIQTPPCESLLTPAGPLSSLIHKNSQYATRHSSPWP